MSSEDIRPILDRWPLSDSHNVRKIIGADGAERIQIRVCIDSYHGILQFDCDGRPDGQRPHGCEFALDYFVQLRDRNTRGGGEFHLDEQDCAELFTESHQIYQRYVLLLQVGDYARVIRDTERNMQLFRFVRTYALREQDLLRLERWWPYIIRIHHTARTLEAMARADYETAAAEIATARRWIGELEELEDETFEVERTRSLEALGDLAEQILRERPMTELDQLELDKQEAVRNEDYHRAAELRDRIELLRATHREAPPGGPGGE